jgi:hypothetical protein
MLKHVGRHGDRKVAMYSEKFPAKNTCALWYIPMCCPHIFTTLL